MDDGKRDARTDDTTAADHAWLVTALMVLFIVAFLAAAAYLQLVPVEPADVARKLAPPANVQDACTPPCDYTCPEGMHYMSHMVEIHVDDISCCPLQLLDSTKYWVKCAVSCRKLNSRCCPNYFKDGVCKMWCHDFATMGQRSAQFARATATGGGWDSYGTGGANKRCNSHTQGGECTFDCDPLPPPGTTPTPTLEPTCPYTCQEWLRSGNKCIGPALNSC